MQERQRLQGYARTTKPRTIAVAWYTDGITHFEDSASTLLGSKQTNKQKNKKQTNKQPNNQTSTQTSKQTNKQTKKQTNKCTILYERATKTSRKERKKAEREKESRKERKKAEKRETKQKREKQSRKESVSARHGMRSIGAACRCMVATGMVTKGTHRRVCFLPEQHAGEVFIEHAHVVLLEPAPHHVVVEEEDRVFDTREGGLVCVSLLYIVSI